MPEAFLKNRSQRPFEREWLRESQFLHALGDLNARVDRPCWITPIAPAAALSRSTGRRRRLALAPTDGAANRSARSYQRKRPRAPAADAASPLPRAAPAR